MTNMSASGGWEKVGKGPGKKSSSNQNGSGKFTKTEKKKFAEKAPKLEDVLPLDQINGAYAFGGTNSNTGSPKKASSQKAKPKVANSNKNNNKQEDVKKATKPKTIEEAVKKISVGELQSLITTVKTMYPNNGALWIKDIAAYFNVNLNCENSVNLDNPFSNYPLSVITRETKKVLTGLYEDCQDSGRENAFSNLLANMAHDMAKGQSPNGYLILLQSMAEIYPALCVNNVSRSEELLRSYKNRVNIGTALMWALGQGGRKDLSVGLKVWIELISDLLPLKNFSRFVLDYLVELLKVHKSKIDSNIRSKFRMLNSLQFLKIFDTIYEGSINKDMQNTLESQYPIIKALAVGNCSLDHQLFPEFMRRLNSAMENSKSNAMKNEICENLTECLLNNKAAISHWQQMYTSFLPASAYLLSYLDSQWKRNAKAINSNLTIRDTFEEFLNYNTSLTVLKDGVTEASKALKSLLGKMKKRSAPGSGNGWFPWKTFSVLLLILIWYQVDKDIRGHKSFEASKTGIFLKDIGLDQLALRSYNFSAEKCADAKALLRQKAPIVEEKFQLLGEKIKPIWAQALVHLDNLAKLASSTFLQLLDKLNDSLPGAKEKFWLYLEEAKRLFGLFVDRFLHYSAIVLNFLVKLSVQVYKNIELGITNLVNGKVQMSDVQKFAEESLKWTTDNANALYKWTVKQVQGLTK